MTNETILDIDALLDTDLDSVESLPDYITPPAGSYVLKVANVEAEKYTAKDKVKKSRLRVTYSIVETVESEEPPMPDGSLFSENYQLSEDGVKYFKKAAMNILNIKDFGKATIREVMDGLKGTEFKALITLKKTEAESGKVYENVNIRAIHS